MGLVRCFKDYGLYFMYMRGKLVLVAVYVHDMMVFGGISDVGYVASTLKQRSK